MKDYGWLPPLTKRSRYRLVRRRTLLTLALVATLATSAVVVQQWVWSGQDPHKTLDFEKALKVLNDPKELPVKRNTAAIYLQSKMIKAIEGLKGFEKGATSEFKGGVQNALRTIEDKAKAK